MAVSAGRQSQWGARFKGIEIIGNADNDTLRGTPFADSLNGFTGLDVMIGGGGNDIYFVDSAGTP